MIPTMTAPHHPMRIMFVCLGNICRSPMAEAIFVHLAQQRGVGERFVVDSSGTGHWHIGDDADHRTLATLKSHSVPINHRARQLEGARDADDWDLFIVMDAMNLRDAIRAGIPAEKVRLMGRYDPRLHGHADDHPRRHVPDPYTGGDTEFQEVYDMLSRCCAALLDELAPDAAAGPMA
ncbi:low molecular weight protein-tyrosine-phosphatase [soil metagenome]